MKNLILDKCFYLTTTSMLVMNDLTNYRSFNDSTLINHQGSATSSDGMNYEIDNLAWDGDLTDGDTFTINFLGLFSNGRPKLISATIDQQDICSQD